MVWGHSNSHSLLGTGKFRWRPPPECSRPAAQLPVAGEPEPGAGGLLPAGDSSQVGVGGWGGVAGVPFGTSAMFFLAGIPSVSVFWTFTSGNFSGRHQSIGGHFGGPKKLFTFPSMCGLDF